MITELPLGQDGAIPARIPFLIHYLLNAISLRVAMGLSGSQPSPQGLARSSKTIKLMCNVFCSHAFSTPSSVSNDASLDLSDVSLRDNAIRIGTQGDVIQFTNVRLNAVFILFSKRYFLCLKTWVVQVWELLQGFLCPDHIQEKKLHSYNKLPRVNAKVYAKISIRDELIKQLR